jgi:hypothetical protein
MHDGRPRRRVRLGAPAAIAPAALLVLLGCSGGTAGDGSLTAVVAEGLRADPDRGELVFERDEARCVADRVVDGLGAERLLDLGADQRPLDELRFDDGEQRIVFDAVRGCIDLAAQVAGFLAADADLPDDVAACVAARYVASGELREALFGRGIDPELEARIDAVLDDALAACTPPAPAV